MAVSRAPTTPGNQTDGDMPILSSWHAGFAVQIRQRERQNAPRPTKSVCPNRLERERTCRDERHLVARLRGGRVMRPNNARRPDGGRGRGFGLGSAPRAGGRVAVHHQHHLHSIQRAHGARARVRWALFRGCAPTAPADVHFQPLPQFFGAHTFRAPAPALFRCKVDGFVPRTQRVNSRTVGQRD